MIGWSRCNSNQPYIIFFKYWLEKIHSNINKVFIGFKIFQSTLSRFDPLASSIGLHAPYNPQHASSLVLSKNPVFGVRDIIHDK